MIKVILIDDEPWLLKGLQGMIPWAELGYEISGVALDGIQGMELVRQLRPQVVFLDIHMPQVNGLEVLYQIRQFDAGILVVILSGHAEFAYAQKALKMGAFDYLLKPTDEDELIKTLEHVRKKLAPSESAERDNPPADQRPVAERVRTYIDANYTRPDLSVQKIAAELYLNSGYVGQVFKRTFGQSIAEYLGIKRMDQAELLLKTGKLTIEEVADRVGINDYFYFNKLYKKRKAITPGKVKKE